jgi:hypothetical protein
MGANQEEFEIIKDCVIPDDKGISRKFKIGKVVRGSHYQKFLSVGIVRRRSPSPPPEPVPEAPSPEPTSGGTAKPTRDELEAMRKSDILEKFPGLKGTKAEIIDQILESQDAEDA